MIARGPVLVSDALPIARQIAEALEAAHEQGIIHRDRKPANIKVRSDGTVRVLDFGLAKALDPNASEATASAMNSLTITSPAMTQAGMILGTAVGSGRCRTTAGRDIAGAERGMSFSISRATP